MNEAELAKLLEPHIERAFADADALYQPRIEELQTQVMTLQGELTAARVMAESLAGYADTAARTSCAAHLDIAAENLPTGLVPAAAAGFEAELRRLRARLGFP